MGQCPSTVRSVFPMLVFQLSKQQNRTRTTSSTVLGTPPNRTRTIKIPFRNYYRPTGRKSRLQIPVFFFWDLVLQCLSVCIVWPTGLQKMHVSLANKLCFENPFRDTRGHFNPNRERPAHELVLPPRTTWLCLLLTPHQRNRQDPVANFCEDGEHRVWKAPRSVPLNVPLNAPFKLNVPRSVPLRKLTTEISQFSSRARFALGGTLTGTLRGTLVGPC